MEITYIEIPTNFVSPKKPNSHPKNKAKEQKCHHMSVPIIQISKSEKLRYSLEVEKQQEAQKTLKLKLKAFGNVCLTNPSMQFSPYMPDISDNKSLPRLPGIFSHRTNLSPQQKNKIFGGSLSTPPNMFEKEYTTGIETAKNFTNDEINTKSPNNISPYHFLSKQAFLNTKIKLNQQDLVEAYAKPMSKDSSVADLKNSKNFPEIHFLKQKQPPRTSLAPFRLLKDPEVPQEIDNSNQQKSARMSLSNRNTASEKKSKRPTMLTFLKDQISSFSNTPPANSRLNNKSVCPITFTITPKVPNLMAENSISAPVIISAQGSNREITQGPQLTDKIKIESDVVQTRKEENIEKSFKEAQSEYSRLKAALQINESGEKNLPQKILDQSIKEIMVEDRVVMKNLKNRARMNPEETTTRPFKFNFKKGAMNPISNLELLDENDPSIRLLVAKAREELPPITRKKLEMAIVKKRLIQRLYKIRDLKLTLREIAEVEDIFSNKPYEKNGSKEFFMATKLGDYDEIKLILQDKDKYIVYDFDHVRLTALHWAAKKGFANIVKLLISYGANTEAKDIIGRTPLYFAIKSNHIEVLKILLANRANPWSTEETNYNEIAKDNYAALYYINKMKKVDLISKMMPPAERQVFWEKQVLDLMADKRFLS